jgi:hypothetical protein
MPIRWQIDRGYTIAANDTQYWWWEDIVRPGQHGFGRYRNVAGNQS